MQHCKSVRSKKDVSEESRTDRRKGKKRDDEPVLREDGIENWTTSTDHHVGNGYKTHVIWHGKTMRSRRRSKEDERTNAKGHTWVQGRIGHTRGTGYSNKELK